MEQMQVPDEMKIILDHEDKTLPYSARVLEPVVFRDGNRYCCLLGKNREEGISGYGNTVPAAIAEWNLCLKKRIDANAEDDELVRYAEAKLNASVYKIN